MPSFNPARDKYWRTSKLPTNKGEGVLPTYFSASAKACCANFNDSNHPRPVSAIYAAAAISVSRRLATDTKPAGSRVSPFTPNAINNGSPIPGNCASMILAAF